MVATALKNTLIVYSGGGYDGCIWEMNWCLWDANGDWHNVFSSGYSGFKTEEQALEEYNWHLEHEDSEEYRDSKIMYVIDLNKEEDFKCLQNYETVALQQLLGSVNNCLAENKQPMVAWFECTMCHEKHYPWQEEPGEVEGLKGNGGVGFVGSEIICPDCHHSHECSYCGEFDEKITHGYCEFCAEKAFGHFLGTLEVGYAYFKKRFVNKTEWVTDGFEIVEPEDLDLQWLKDDMDIEPADFDKPEKMDPDNEYLWVVEVNGKDYLLRAKTADEAGSNALILFNTSADDVTLAAEAWTIDYTEELTAAQNEEREKWRKEQERKAQES